MNRKALIVGLCGAAAGIAQAQPFSVNISGATLQASFLSGSDKTIDAIDVDGDTFLRDQLGGPGLGAGASNWWQVGYRATGSGNGLQELIDFGLVGATGADGVELDSADAADGAWINITQYVAGGATNGNAVLTNPGASPVLANAAGDVVASGGAYYVDVAILDVPSNLFVEKPGGTPNKFAKPNDAGYGGNDRLAVNKDGSVTTQDNGLANFGASPLTPADLYDTPVAFVAIAYITNLGTGVQEMTIEDLQYHFTTGRRECGENLMALTRDSGSGTRNGAMNSLGIDPSWGVGENIGVQDNQSSNDPIGPNYQPTNLGGSSRMEGRTQNTRLGIGYTGAERLNNWYGTLPGNDPELEVVGVIRGTTAVRPTLNNVLGVDGSGNDLTDLTLAYTYGGNGSYITIGDPRSGLVSTAGNDAGNTNPAMRNLNAAEFVNNITRSIEQFIALPTDPSVDFTPGEALAEAFILPGALAITQDAACPGMAIDNGSNTNEDLLDFVFTDRTNALDVMEDTFGVYTINAGRYGEFPVRNAAGAPYSDGALNGGGTNYVAQGGATGSAGADITWSRSWIAGDFNGDGVRNCDDASDLVAAYRDRYEATTWVAPNGTGLLTGRANNTGAFACIELLGDFDGNGSYDALDVRYWADGLALDPTTGKLNRCEGFTKVDEAYLTQAGSNNFFGTTLATGAAYTAGASAADIAGNGTTRGFAPAGSDGIVDDADLDYIIAQFAQFGDGSADWSDLNEACMFDLSADIDGDLDVDADDLCKALGFLGTEDGDVNLDGVRDGADVAIVNTNFGMALSGWANGDLNGDGMVDGADLAIANGTNDRCEEGPCNNADLAQPFGVLNFADVQAFLGQFGQGLPGADLAAPMGVFNFADVQAFLGLFGQGCN